MIPQESHYTIFFIISFVPPPPHHYYVHVSLYAILLSLSLSLIRLSLFLVFSVFCQFLETVWESRAWCSEGLPHKNHILCSLWKVLSCTWAILARPDIPPNHDSRKCDGHQDTVAAAYLCAKRAEIQHLRILFIACPREGNFRTVSCYSLIQCSYDSIIPFFLFCCAAKFHSLDI